MHQMHKCKKGTKKFFSWAKPLCSKHSIVYLVEQANTPPNQREIFETKLCKGLVHIVGDLISQLCCFCSIRADDFKEKEMCFLMRLASRQSLVYTVQHVHEVICQSSIKLAYWRVKISNTWSTK